jgi:aminomethyltransferase
MKKTALSSIHEALGARMAEFAGYWMPISYKGISEEHHAVRNRVGIFDVSHMGEFIVKGREALDLIQIVTSNNVASLKIGQAQYSCLPNKEGGIVDDLLVYRLDEDKCAEGEQAYMLVVNASNIEKDWRWIESHNKYDARLVNISDQTGLLAVQGPKAAEILQSLTDVKLSDILYYHFTKGTMAGVDNVLISATGYTGSGGFELYVANEHLETLWLSIMEAGQSAGIEPCGLGARDTLRLEMGYCLYGNDINDTTSPIEAGLGWITKTKKPANFNSRDIFIQQRAEGVHRKLVGFTLTDRRVPRKDYPILNESGDAIGVVTSGTQSPTLGYPIGMGYVASAYANPGSYIKVVAGKKELDAKITPLPFVKIE